MGRKYFSDAVATHDPELSALLFRLGASGLLNRATLPHTTTVCEDRLHSKSEKGVRFLSLLSVTPTTDERPCPDVWGWMQKKTADASRADSLNRLRNLYVVLVAYEPTEAEV